ncbi:winged helix-turn-helix domain-containing protein [Leucobacter sp. GX24907]
MTTTIATAPQNDTLQALRAARPDLAGDLPEQAPSQPAAGRRVPEGTEVRGFALYIGLSEEKIAEGDPQLGAIVAQLKSLVSQLAPAADTYAAVALAPEGAGGRDVDVVRLALGDPAAQARQSQQNHTEEDEQDRAAGGVTIDLSRKRVLLDNVPAVLTFREFELLQFLVLREGRTVSREELISSLWADAPASETPSERTIDVHVRRLRVKLAQYQDIVRTVRGVGYRFDRHADVAILHSSSPSPDIF